MKTNMRSFLIIFFVACALFLPVIMTGHTFKPAPVTSGVLPTGAYGYDGPALSHSNSMDAWGSFYEDTLRIFGKKSILSGEFPFWNPNQGIGQPYFANHVSGFMSPFGLLSLVIPYIWWDILDIFNLILIVCFSYLFFNITGLSRRIALFASLAMMSTTYFTGYLVVTSLMTSVLWVFFLLYSIERTLKDFGWRWKVPAIVFGAYCLFTAGHPSPMAIGGLFVGAYLLFRIAFNKKLLKPGLLIVLLMLLGLLLAAPEWMIFLDYVSQVPALNIHRNYQYSFSDFRGVFLPYAFHPTHLSMVSLPSMISFFAVAGIVYVFRKRPRGAHAVLIGLWLLFQWKVIGLFPSSYLENLPVINSINFQYGWFITVLVWALFAGFGFAFLCRNPVQFFRKTIPAWIILISLVTLALLYTYLRIGELHVLRRLVFDRSIFDRLPLLAGCLWFVLVPVSFYILHRQAPGSSKRFELLAFSGLSIQTASYFVNGKEGGSEFAALIGIVSYILFFIMLLFFGRKTTKLFSFRVFFALLVALTAVMVLSVVHYYPGHPKRYDFLTPAPYISELQQLIRNGERSMGWENILFGNISGPLGFSSINVIMSLQTVENWKFFQRFVDHDLLSSQLFYIEGHNYNFSEENRKIFELLAAKYCILISGGFATFDPPIRKVYEDSKTGVKIFENTAAGERVFFIPSVEWVSSHDEALSMIPHLAEMKDIAFIEERYKPFLPKNAEISKRNSKGKLRSVRFTPNHVYIEYDVPHPGFIVLADAYMPGWKAKIDDKETPVFPVNGVFRGIFVDKGGHVSIEFWYKPRLWNLGLLLAGIGLISFLGIMLRQFLEKARAHKA